LSSTDLLPLTALARELRVRYGLETPYSRLWRHVADGLIPAERSSGKWHVRRADLPKIAASLGYSAPAEPVSATPAAQLA
jgi:hypothetical protein